MRRIESVTKAYHSTKQKGLKKFESRTTTATIDTGEGAHIHGWGLYLQADEEMNRDSYYNMFAGVRNEDKILTAWGDTYNAEATDDFPMINDYESVQMYTIKHNYGKGSETSIGEDLCFVFLLNGYTPDDCYGYFDNAWSEMSAIEDEIAERGDIVWEELQENESIPELWYHYSADEFLDARNVAKSLSDKDYEITDVEPEVLEDGTHSINASQYTVEIPDDMVFIDEDEMVEPHVLEKYANFICNDSSWIDNYVRNTRIRGRTLYEKLQKKLGSDEQASLWLAEHGIDGMTYEGGRDHGCFVIYNCDKLKIVGEY